MKNTELIILSLKKSKKLKFLKKRLREIGVNYSILYGIDGRKPKNHNFLKKYYDDEGARKFTGRSLRFPEIAASLAHINAYKHIVLNNISSAIIVEDDAYPSMYLKHWIESGCKIKNNLILSFYSYPGGYVSKVSYKNYLKGKIKAYKAKTHLYNSSFYQINLNTCKTILKLTGGKVKAFGDWPILPNDTKIKFATTIPYLTVMDKFNNSLIKNYRIESNNFLPKLIGYRVTGCLRDFFHFFGLGYFFSKNKNSQIYFHHYFYKSLVGFVNLFNRKYLDTKKLYFNKDTYAEDLHKDLKIMIANSDIKL